MKKLSIYGDPIPNFISSDEKENIYLKTAENIIRSLLKKQNSDGSWGKKDEFNRIYYTTQVLQTLFHAGFPLSNKNVSKALKFLDKFRVPHVDNRAVYFLYIAMERLNEDEIYDYIVKLLRRRQNEDGSFLFQVEKENLEKEIREPSHWGEEPKRHRGMYIFHTLHTLQMLTMIDYQKFKSIKIEAEKIMSNCIKFLKQNEKQFHILPDKFGNLDAEFTCWWLERLSLLEGHPPDYKKTIKWILDQQTKGIWKGEQEIKGKRIEVVILPTCYTIYKLCSFSYDDENLTNQVKASIRMSLIWLIKNRELWEKDINKSAIVARTLINGNNFIDPNKYPHIYRISIYSHLIEKLKLCNRVMIYKVLNIVLILFILFLLIKNNFILFFEFVNREIPRIADYLTIANFVIGGSLILFIKYGKVIYKKIKSLFTEVYK